MVSPRFPKEIGSTNGCGSTCFNFMWYLLTNLFLQRRVWQSISHELCYKRIAPTLKTPKLTEFVKQLVKILPYIFFYYFIVINIWAMRIPSLIILVILSKTFQPNTRCSIKLFVLHNTLNIDLSEELIS